ncbi:hypothetical protein F8S09_03490 [Deinococcus sp. SDU3-2]|uniref:Uncharacterized protein n=1 Tax=Deinococcus terrestris TaxID=2651870 RepID=A0A7X1NTY3_9DEIO|nr:hypothetical protein [Deinococcus terrestris]MPY65761.1 hypothetical protein [Deinococcus terrestris]
MDKIIDKIVGLGVPGLVLLFLVGASGFAGAAAITSSLALLGGPLGMMGGIAMLGILAMISRSIARYGFDNLARATVKRMKTQGQSKVDIWSQVKAAPISGDLKRKIRDFLDEIFLEDPLGG